MTPSNRPGRSQVKHDPEYQERRGIVAGPAKKLAPELRAHIQQRAKRICRTLELDGYCRIDTADAHLPLAGPSLGQSHSAAVNTSADAPHDHIAHPLSFEAAPGGPLDESCRVDDGGAIDRRDLAAVDQHIPIDHRQLNVPRMSVIDEVLHGIEHRLQAECPKVKHDQVRALARLEFPIGRPPKPRQCRSQPCNPAMQSIDMSYLRFEHPRSFFAAMSFGNCGYAFPTAIGAKVGAPDRPPSPMSATAPGG